MLESAVKARVYVSAILCESTIREETTNLLTAIRISDGFAINPAKITPKLPDGTLDTRNTRLFIKPVTVSLIISLRSESAASFEFNLKGFRPSGKPLTSLFGALNVEIGPNVEGGRTFNVRLTVPTDEQGDFWFEFYVDDILANKMPLRITHNSGFDSLEEHTPKASLQSLSVSSDFFTGGAKSKLMSDRRSATLHSSALTESALSRME
jgi:hypothetical protein